MMEYLFTKTPLLFFVQDLWRDEAFSVLLSERSFGEIIQLTVRDFSPPLYYILLKYWMLLWGTSEVAIRSLSLVFALGTVVLIIDMFSRVWKLSLGRIILMLPVIILNPFLLYYGFEGRMYAMVAFLITWAYWARFQRKTTLSIIAMTLALYTQYLAILILLFHALEDIGHFLWKHRNAIGSPWRPYTHAVMKGFLRVRTTRILPIARTLLMGSFHTFRATLVPLLILSPWVVYMLVSREGGSRDFWVIQPPLADVTYIPFVLFTGYERVFGEYYHGRAGYTDFHMWMNALLLVPVIGGLILGVGTRLLRPSSHDPHASKRAFLPENTLSLVLWAFGPPLVLFVMSFLSTPLYHPRYFIFAAPGFVILLLLMFNVCADATATFAQQIVSRWNTRRIPFLGVLILALLVAYTLHTLFLFQDLNLTYRAKRTISPLYREIASVRTPADPVYVTNELDFHLAQYYISRSGIYIYKKTYEEIPQYVGKVLIPQSAIATTVPAYPQRAYVVFYDTYEIQSTF